MITVEDVIREVGDEYHRISGSRYNECEIALIAGLTMGTMVKLGVKIDLEGIDKEIEHRKKPISIRNRNANVSNNRQNFRNR